jgi:hypothetical protein
VGDGFEALGAVLWTALSNCQAENDIHNASVIMMLSQVRVYCLCLEGHCIVVGVPYLRQIMHPSTNTHTTSHY